MRPAADDAVPTTGPLLAVSVLGIVDSLSVLRTAELPLLECRLLSPRLSKPAGPSIAPSSYWTLDRPILNLVISGRQALGRSGHARPIAEGHLLFALGRMQLRPLFDAASGTYTHMHELSVTDEFGFARTVFAETFSAQ
jgi:hypothetical protein